MINFRCTHRVELTDIGDIISEKYNPGKAVLLGIKAKISTRYSKFIDIETNSRITPAPFTADEKTALLSLYGSRTKTAQAVVDNVISMLRPEHSDCCLYCGIGEIDQVDHYLPQEHFPEYCILHKNLIPICGTCNEIKGSNIPGQGRKDYLHLIYNVLPLERLLDCTVSFNHSLPTVTYDILPKFAGTIYNTHFSELKLKERLEKKSVQYCLQIKALKEQFGSAYAKEELSRDLNKSSAFFGNYYWRSELISKMITVNFVDQVT